VQPYLEYIFSVLKRKVVEDGCTLHFLDASKININKLLKHRCTKEVVEWLSARILKGLGKLKTIEHHSSSEYVQCRDHTAFLVKAYTDCFRHNPETVFNQEKSITVLCLASESQEIII